MSFIKPKKLSPGDTVCVVASSSPFEKESFLEGVELLKSLGFKVKYQKSIFSKHKHHPYLAGSEKRRFQEFRKTLYDDSVKAIFFARGGYGAAHLIPFLLQERKKPMPKILAGFSDTTTLHLYAQKKWRWVVLYSPCIGGNMRQLTDQETLTAFQKVLFTDKPLEEKKYSDMVVIKKGETKARVVGGCLTLVANSLATPYEIETKNRILFLEDVHEKPYQVDRLLMHLKLAGKLKDCRAIMIGQLNGPNPIEHYEKTIADVVKDLPIPVVMNLPIGHVKKSMTLPLGVHVHLSTRHKRLSFLESALAS